MNQNESNHFKDQLTRQLTEVSNDYKVHSKLRDTPGESEASEVSEPIAESEENLAAKISAALDRLAEGTFGNCTGCGQLIPMSRLQAKPCVSLCLDCQNAKERGAHATPPGQSVT